jgi:hypothetical protein
MFNDRWNVSQTSVETRQTVKVSVSVLSYCVKLIEGCYMRMYSAYGFLLLMLTVWLLRMILLISLRVVVL